MVDIAGKSIPAVLLGCLLNILDGVSYGMIIFPGTGVFAGLGPLGVSMFFLSTVIAQLTYTLGGSGFVGANGSMMIEIVPFFHILATTISAYIGEDKPKEVIATTLVAFALSAVLTGLSFLMLGLLKLGVIVGFFPRHILVGCIGGVGVFLIRTGLTVSMRIGEDDLGANWETIEMMFMDSHKLILWSLPMGLAILLRLVTHKWHHQLIFPLYFIAISLIFYIIVAAAQVNLWDLRHTGWIFDMGTGKHKGWYELYSYYDFSVISYGALWATLPTQFALLFFNILHPPLNVPALSVSLNTDVDTNKELVAHGYSNLLSGFAGSVPNYLVYVNTLLFYRVGGASRIAGFLLAVMDVLLLWVGTAPIAYIPVMVVGALIFVLGIDLVKEALWDTRDRTTRMEYITIASIMICMTVWDFVSGVLFGIIISCFFFVVQNSQRTSIRALHSGETAMSTVRRPSSQRAFLREVSKQTTIIRLQGFLFFGTISGVEDTIRGIVQGPSWQDSPLQFLVLDLSLVAGVDMSAAEAFVRIHRILTAKSITLVFCGLDAESPVGQALESVRVLDSDGVELFATFNDAMEWTENAYLRAWFTSQKCEATSTALELPGRQDGNDAIGSFTSSPRRSYMHDVGNRTIANDPEHPCEPYNTLVKAFSSYGELDPDLFRPIGQYLEKISFAVGSVLWEQDESPDGVYIVQSGVLRATYQFADYTQCVEESMVPGTVAGELSALSGLPRNATVIVERDATVWRLSMEDLERLETEQPKLAKSLLHLLLKAAKTDHDILLSALTCRQ
ncbi:sulfate transporter family-domain-containing protein [Collybia nuda]|uniref:Sulfate transporter family-domain-containing protein n=1 Tax=Collybia nuda TaxID=64659 RepID=A0A9P5YFS1_9AGAR|nr:sulfate transporter family-domain-containing protein [Collybia nuda]